MQPKIESNVFFLLVSTIFSPKEGEFEVSPFHDYNIWSLFCDKS